MRGPAAHVLGLPFEESLNQTEKVLHELAIEDHPRLVFDCLLATVFCSRKIRRTTGLKPKN